jgi:hypothetical protein
VTDIREILRRLQLGEPDLARDLGISRNTVAHYRVRAARHAVLTGGPLPDPATLAGLLEPAPTERPAHEQSLVEPLRERVLAPSLGGLPGGTAAKGVYVAYALRTYLLSGADERRYHVVNVPGRAPRCCRRYDIGRRIVTRRWTE